MPRHEFKHLRLMLSLFRWKYLKFHDLFTKFFLLSTKYEFRAFPSSASIFRFFKLHFCGKFLKFWQEMGNTNSRMKTMKKKLCTNCKLNRCKISTKQVISETASLFDLFGAKFPYFGPNFHISGQMSLFRAKCPYFGEKYLKFRPRSEFKVFFDEIRTFGPK